MRMYYTELVYARAIVCVCEYMCVRTVLKNLCTEKGKKCVANQLLRLLKHKNHLDQSFMNIQ